MAILEDLYLVSDFAESRNVDRNAVTQYIRRHPELFEGHTQVESQRMYFDDKAMEYLDKKYPLPAPVEVIPDTRSRDLLVAEQQKTIMLQEDLMKLKDQLHDTQLQLTKKESSMLLLEDKSQRMESENTELKEKLDQRALEMQEKDRQLAEATTSLDFKQKELDAELNRAEEAKSEIEALRAQLEASEQKVNNMKKASLWERIKGWKNE